MSIESIQSALDELRDTCPVVTVRDDFNAVFISDIHLGVKDDADDFNKAGHEKLLLDILNRPTIKCIGGDFVDLWENRYLGEIWGKYPKIYDSIMKAHYWQIQGNHNPIKDLPVAMKFIYPDGRYIFWTHGHKGDWSCDAGSGMSKFFVRYIWAGMGQRVFGMADPTTARKEGNPNKHLEVRQAMNEWVNRQDEKMIGTIWGHSHYQEQEGKSFNDGSWIAEVAQGAEIKNRKISLTTFM